MIKAALIDLDGTILDSMGMWETLGEDILTSLGFTSDEDINELFKSFTIRQAAEYYHDHFPTKRSIAELEEVINSAIENAYTNELPLKEGAGDFIKGLKDKGILLALVTTTNGNLARKALKRLDVLKDFDVILTCDDLNCSKNEPTIYNKALEELNVAKNEAIVFEDALHALKTAKDNGYLTVGVFDPYVNEQDEIQNVADYYLKDFKKMDDLLNMIQEGKREHSVNNSGK